MRGRILALVLLAISMVASEARGQEWRGVVARQLDAAGALVRAEGRTDANVLARNQLIGVLEEGVSSYVEVQLDGGVEYFFVGVCDGDCSDLDLRLFVADGFDAVASDIETDDVPLLTFSAPTSGAYLLGVDMVDCTEEFCYYGVRIYQH